MVWLRSGASAPAGLLNALAMRGLRVTVVVDAAAALREIIRGGVALLVLHESHRLGRVGELLDTLDRYHPHLRAFRFGEGGEHGGADRSEPGADDRLIALGAPAKAGTSASDASDVLSSRVTVSEAELAMLLGPADDDDDDDDDGEGR